MSAPLEVDRIYSAFDRFVCGRVQCAGMTAVHTGTTTDGFPLRPITADDVHEWARYDLGPLTCECGAVLAL